MATLDDVQNAITNVVANAIYPNGINSASTVGSVVDSITVNNSGANYTYANVVISGGGGSNSQASATITNGQITAINLIKKGAGFTSTPTVTITGDGSGATASATLYTPLIYVFPGDPLKQDLDNDLRAYNINVGVFAQKAMTRNTTRVRDLYASPQKQVATIFLTVNYNVITVTGTITAGQVGMVILNGIGYAYMAQSNDTLNSFTANLASLIPGASVVNNVITITGVQTLLARISVPGTMRRILNSEEGVFRVRVVAPSHETREITGKILQLALATLTPRYYLAMPDGISSSIRSKGIDEINQYELALSFTRDYLYLVEYHVVDVSNFQSIADAYSTNTVT